MTSNVAGRKTLAVVLGATATGKTGVGIRLAQAFGSEIVSSDSRQIYREMSIGTAKPTAEELAAVPHHFIDTRSVSEDYSAGRYEEDSQSTICCFWWADRGSTSMRFATEWTRCRLSTKS